jgi:TonB family protein
LSNTGFEYEVRRDGADVNISPHLGRVPYGAKELQRVYVKQMSRAFILSVVLTFALLSSLRFLVDPEAFNPKPQHVVRIFTYSEVELPRSLSNVELGMSAYPIIQDVSMFSEITSPDASHPAAALRSGSSSGKQGVPGERRPGEGLSSLPGPGGVDKMQADDRSTYPSDMGNRNAPADHHDIAGGSGESLEPQRKSGRPVPGKAGEPPSGVDRSGIGGSSRPSAGTTAYGLGPGDGVDGEGGGVFSMNWLQGMIRRKLSGELPKYPQGTTVSAQVRILAVVLPDGTVRSVQPEQKANRLLEETAMKAIRSWKFEPLGQSLPQVEQSCIISFSFKLK